MIAGGTRSPRAGDVLWNPADWPGSTLPPESARANSATSSHGMDFRVSELDLSLSTFRAGFSILSWSMSWRSPFDLPDVHRPEPANRWKSIRPRVRPGHDHDAGHRQLWSSSLRDRRRLMPTPLQAAIAVGQSTTAAYPFIAPLPAPTHKKTTRSPSLTRPARRSSSSRIRVLAAEVLP